MGAVRFIRVRGRIIPVFKKLAGEVQNIPSVFKKGPKAMNQRKGATVLAKIEGKIAGANGFLNDSGSTMSQVHSSGLRKEVSRNRDRFFKVKHALEDNLNDRKAFKSAQQSGKRGLVKVGSLSAGIGAAGWLGLSKGSNKNGK